jgi:histidine ammonia-lyase
MANRSSSFWKRTELAKRATIKIPRKINTISSMEKLIAANAADGKSIDVKSAEAKKMSEKVQEESEAFRAAVK